MERLLLLIPLILSLTYKGEYAVRVPWGQGVGAGVFLGVLAGLVGATRFYAAEIARRSGETDIEMSAAKLGRMTGWARGAALLWSAAGMYVLGWHDAGVPKFLTNANMALATALFSTWPVYVSWILLYWAQYPSERAVREQAMVSHLSAGFPPHQTVTLWTYLDHHVRSDMGAVLAPALAGVAARDVIWGVLRESGAAATIWGQGIAIGMPAIGAIVFAPALLRHVFRTRRLPDGVLRVRLAGLAERAGVGYSEVLVWDTRSAAANALVMGLVPGLRYVLLSDLLIQTMPDEEIEAEFAHELGHIVHRHRAWSFAFLFGGALLMGWTDLVGRQLAREEIRVSQGWMALGTVATVGALFYLFAMLSRRFEIEADVFAARCLPAAEAPRRAAVAPGGAAVYGQALRRLAMVNNIPVSTGSWMYDSTVRRAEIVRRLGDDASATARFDEGARWTRVGICAVVVAGAATAMLLLGAG